MKIVFVHGLVKIFVEIFILVIRDGNGFEAG
jgi:hypothetical protein